MSAYFENLIFLKKRTKVKKFFECFTKTDKVSFWVCLSVSIFLIIVSFFTPPRFVIDSSVIMTTGELWAFAALGVAVHAVGKGSDITVKKGDTEVTMNNPDVKE